MNKIITESTHEQILKLLKRNECPSPDFVVTKWDRPIQQALRRKRGIYIFRVQFRPVYIGASYTNLGRRISRLFKPYRRDETDFVKILSGHFFSQRRLAMNVGLYFMPDATPSQLQEIEQLFIVKLKPKINSENRKFNIKRLEQLQIQKRIREQKGRSNGTNSEDV